MTDDIKRIEEKVINLAKNCEKNKDDISNLRLEIYSRFSSQDIRLSEINSSVNSLKEKIDSSISRIEDNIKGLSKNQNETSKEVTTVVTKMTIVFGVVMIVISAFLKKFVG